jgi:hypothetical protein
MRLAEMTATAVMPVPSPEANQWQAAGVQLAADIVRRLMERVNAAASTFDHWTFGSHGPVMEIPAGLAEYGSQLVVRLGRLSDIPVAPAQEATWGHIPVLRGVVLQSGIPLVATRQPMLVPTLAVSLLFLTSGSIPTLHAVNLGPGFPTFLAWEPRAEPSIIDSAQQNQFPPGHWTPVFRGPAPLTAVTLSHCRDFLLDQIATMPN